MFKEYFDKKKLIIFDLDGTIVRTNIVWNMAFSDVANAMEQPIYTFGEVGTNVEQRWKQIIVDNAISNPRPMSELIELTQNAFLNHLDDLELTDGFWPFVAELKLRKKLNLALVTNTSRVVTDRVIAKLELKEVFDFVLCGNEVKKPKPDPEIYKKTLQHFKLSHKDALAFEDSLTGCIAAAKAKIKTICVWDGETPKRRFPDKVVAFTRDFTPFPGEMDTTYFEDILQMAKEQKESEERGEASAMIGT